ncbi:MAG: DUF362 domain-containing protein [Acidobacteria bacterium]|jgi:hypothetical protein|nr:DUF362 domain-containing protein [Acidobacteriota bacterium]
MKKNSQFTDRGSRGLDRRGFLAAAGTALAAGLLPGRAFAQEPSQKPAPPARPDPLGIRSNVHAALCQPKKSWSMPGPFPGIVAEVHLPGALQGGQPAPGAAKRMLAAAMRSLTGEKDARDAWRRFVTPGERIGIKFNPVGHKVSGVTWDVIGAVVDGLESAGIPRRDMLVWHRFNDEHAQTYKPELAHPGVEAYLLNWFIVKDGKNTPGGFERWDESVFYEADVSLPDEQNYLEEMFHGGTKSYFPRILTHGGKDGGVDKVINIPCFKHHGGPFITMALKNLAFGVTTNCPRGHFFIERYISEVCAFPPVRDKVVLNIMDGLRGQYDRGPVPAPQFVWPLERLYAASDPVAMDSVGFEVLLAKQIEAGRLPAARAEEVRKKHYGLAVAENLGLGVHASRPIETRTVVLG